MPRKYRLYLQDIVKSATKVERYIENTADVTEFKSDDFTIDAVLHNLMIIGEAAKTFHQQSRIITRKSICREPID
jgi:uncharacterized protein with HEPN domain